MNGIDYNKSLAQKEKNKEAGLKFWSVTEDTNKAIILSFGFRNSKWVAQ